MIRYILDGDVSFGDKVLPDLAQTLELITLDLSVVILVAIGILQAEDREELVGREVINGLEGSFGVIVSVEVIANGIRSVLVGQCVKLAQTG